MMPNSIHTTRPITNASENSSYDKLCINSTPYPYSEKSYLMIFRVFMCFKMFLIFRVSRSLSYFEMELINTIVSFADCSRRQGYLSRRKWLILGSECIVDRYIDSYEEMVYPWTLVKKMLPFYLSPGNQKMVRCYPPHGATILKKLF